MTDWQARLRQLPVEEWATLLDANSGLPGPRANTALAAAFAVVADESALLALGTRDDEFTAMCVAAAHGAHADENEHVAAALHGASDDRWRVREGVAMGLQLLGDRDVDRLADIVSEWVESEDPLVQRAAVAAICEPRLLRSPASAAVAVRVCARATALLAGRPAAVRRDADVRTLRQALGYGWSVAVAADPAVGLPAFLGLDTSDADVARIVAENRKKKRLSALL
ncbi:HEAT repeat domain-containing protein [Microbacterium sp. Clip185]|uniref:HEAT repeat domain-containing protein n=1 Tax=Microbacterium sp. Clip185 TaxID=3025663 RepID=UPI002364FCF6|nr:HEAT repeat domain-containing protein [Microbacterium sp. Clip185]WDG17175.1 HEAT repeat domain-containing protein [Microbacterium sp. Clip185]